jgi:hypothetical protein
MQFGNRLGTARQVMGKQIVSGCCLQLGPATAAAPAAGGYRGSNVNWHQQGICSSPVLPAPHMQGFRVEVQV